MYFDENFGAFYRIDTGWITPLDPSQAEHDIFQKPYLNLLSILEGYIMSDSATLNGFNYTVDDFCYKPITGEGCLVESPMQYWKSNATLLNLPETNVKETAQCIPPPD
jgi:hypothetical protein